MSDARDKAQQIVLSIRRRRLTGEVLSDAEVLAAHPELYTELKTLLERARKLDEARTDADCKSPVQEFGTDAVSPVKNFSADRALLDDSADRFEHSPSAADIRMTVIEDAETLRGTRSTDPSRGGTSRPQTPDAPGDLADTQSFRPTIRPPMAIIKIYHDGMNSFSIAPVFAAPFLIGRTEGALNIPHDFRISGEHAEIQRRRLENGFGWFLVDRDSTNGTFVRVERVRLHDRDEILMGQERYRFVHRDQRTGLEHLSADCETHWTFAGDDVWVGRRFRNLDSFQHDPFLDPDHARFQRTSKGWTVRDNKSLNGLWYRVREVQLLQPCSFQLGEQRFGFIPC